MMLQNNEQTLLRQFTMQGDRQGVDLRDITSYPLSSPMPFVQVSRGSLRWRWTCCGRLTARCWWT